MEIKKKLTPHNYTAMAKKDNLYIVVHYVGAVSTAKNNADYLYNNSTSASAHYFVDENDIYQVVLDKDKAWHCGGGLQSNLGHAFYQKCTNSNSIGVELCCKIKNGDEWYFEDKTVENAIELIQYLMDKHNIPIERVIRHYDVTGKNCPAPFIDEGVWAKFKEEITGGNLMGETEKTQFESIIKQIKELTSKLEEFEKAVGKVYHYTKELPDWARPTIQRLLDEGRLSGASESDLNLPEILMRALIVQERKAKE